MIRARLGAFVAVVGPSGAGKDTLIAYARNALSAESRVEFVRRVITRRSDGVSEDHDSLTDAAFEQALAAGAFALAWEAHGLRYGLPASIDETIAGGHVAVANVSRGAVSALRRRYANVIVVEIRAPPEVLAARLAARGRETKSEAMARLARMAAPERGDVLIDNSGDRHAAGERLVTAIRETLSLHSG